MKKYSLLVILIVLFSTFALSACSKSATASSHFANFEDYTYTVYNYVDGEKQAVGTLNLSVSLASYATINWGASVPEEYGQTNFNGFKVSYHLVMNNGDTIDSVSYFSNDKGFRPCCAHKVVSIHSNGVDRDESVYTRFDYSKSNRIMFYSNLNGIEQPAVKCGRSSVADNESIYTVLRTYDMSANVSLNYAIPDFTTAATRSISVAKSTGTTVKVDLGSGEKEYSVYTISLSLNDKMKGVSYLVYYAVEDIKVNGVSLVRVPLVIREGDYEYRLTSINSASK